MLAPAGPGVSTGDPSAATLSGGSRRGDNFGHDGRGRHGGRRRRGGRIHPRDERARALERNIHDGAQQQLVALAVKLWLARSFADKDSAEGGGAAGRAPGRGRRRPGEPARPGPRIYPPLLADQGLAAALAAQARKSAVPVSVEADAVGRYAQEVEAAVYFARWKRCRTSPSTRTRPRQPCGSPRPTGTSGSRSWTTGRGSTRKRPATEAACKGWPTGWTPSVGA